MPIIIAPLNTELTIIKVLVDSKLKQHLESLGIIKNSKLKIIANTNGNVVCLIKDNKIALDKDVASKILVA